MKQIIKIVSSLLILLVFFVGKHYSDKYYEGYEDYQNMMVYLFEDFGLELANIDKQLGVVLENKNLTMSDSNYVDPILAKYLLFANYHAADQGDFREKSNYIFMYRNVNQIMQTITSDKILTKSEKLYIQTLQDYTQMLIKSHNLIMEAQKESYDYKKGIRFRKKIAKVYESFSNTAQTLLQSPKYAFLENYQGDFESFDIEHAEKVCNELLLKINKDKKFVFDDRNEVNLQILMFRTNLEETDFLSMKSVRSDQIDYEITYQKVTREVVLRSYREGWVRDEPYKPYNKATIEANLDQMATKISQTINKNTVLSKRKIHYQKNDGKNVTIGEIEYVFTQKINDIDTNPKNINIRISEDGLINEIRFIDTD